MGRWRGAILGTLLAVVLLVAFLGWAGPGSGETKGLAGDNPQGASDGTASFPTQSLALTATLTGPYVLLKWTPPTWNGGAKITGYQIYRAKVAAPLNRFLKVGVRTSYTDTLVTSGVTYFYRIAAINRVGTGKKSNEKSATVP